MLRRNPDGWSAWRQALFALVPVLIGAGIVLSAGDGPATGISRIEATQARPAPAPGRPAAEAAPADVPRAVAAEPQAPPTASAEAPAPGLQATVSSPGPAGAAPAPAAVTADATSTALVATRGTTTPPPPEPVPSAEVTTTTTALPATTTTTTTTPPPAPIGPTRTTSAEAEVVPLTNADRTQNGLSALSRNACLDSAASGFAEQMLRNGVLAHNSGAGGAVVGCRPGAAWGDNVGRAQPCDTTRLEQEWMASPGHRRNVLTAEFKYIGVGAWTDAGGQCWVQVLFSS